MVSLGNLLLQELVQAIYLQAVVFSNVQKKKKEQENGAVVDDIRRRYFRPIR